MPHSCHHPPSPGLPLGEDPEGLRRRYEAIVRENGWRGRVPAVTRRPCGGRGASAYAIRYRIGAQDAKPTQVSLRTTDLSVAYYRAGLVIRRYPRGRSTAAAVRQYIAQLAAPTGAGEAGTKVAGKYAALRTTLRLGTLLAALQGLAGPPGVAEAARCLRQLTHHDAVTRWPDVAGKIDESHPALGQAPVELVLRADNLDAWRTAAIKRAGRGYAALAADNRCERYTHELRVLLHPRVFIKLAKTGVTLPDEVVQVLYAPAPAAETHTNQPLLTSEDILYILQEIYHLALGGAGAAVALVAALYGGEQHGRADRVPEGVFPPGVRAWVAAQPPVTTTVARDRDREAALRTLQEVLSGRSLRRSLMPLTLVGRVYLEHRLGSRVRALRLLGLRDAVWAEERRYPGPLADDIVSTMDYVGDLLSQCAARPAAAGADK